MSRIDLNLFVVFEAVYRERNLTRAAEMLCLSQPAVSNALSRLRRSLEDPLFIRTQQGMKPTPVAENIIGDVREALRLMDGSLREGRHFQPEKADRTFRIHMSDLTAAMLLPPLTECLARQAPGIRLASHPLARRDLVRELAAGEMDLAVDAPLLSDPQLCHAPLLREAYVCMLRRDHPCAGRDLGLEDYLALDHVHVSSRRSGQGHVEMALNALGRRRSVQVRLPHYMVAPQVVLRSDLALTAPLGLARQYDACLMPLPFDLPDLDLHLYWHKSREEDPANCWMRDRIMEISGKRA